MYLISGSYGSSSNYSKKEQAEPVLFLELLAGLEPATC